MLVDEQDAALGGAEREGDAGCAGCWAVSPDHPSGDPWPVRPGPGALRASQGLLAPGVGCEPVSLAEDGALLACVSGSPRWADPMLHDLSREHGHARALANAWRANGEDLLAKLRGTFAVALSDTA
ncbi:MAG: hypothetical protein AAFX85_04470, partial [Pseudomonadota bacterium]